MRDSTLKAIETPEIESKDPLTDLLRFGARALGNVPNVFSAAQFLTFSVLKKR